jgi:hypothetical protein
MELRVLLEKPPVAQLLKNLPTLYETPKIHFLVRHTLPLVPILSQINPVRCTVHILLRIILILFTQLLLGLPGGIPTNVLQSFFCSSFALYALPISSSLISS